MKTPFRLRFRIVHVLYATAVLAAGLATFGPAGFLPALMILGGWILVFSSRSPRGTLGLLCLLVLGAGCLFALLLPSVSNARQAARRMVCQGHLKQIALAMYNYYEDYGSFPPAYLPDDAGRPKHSWRVLLLPYLDQRKLYDDYDMQEPWDGPHNRKLVDRMPETYRCPSHPPASGRSTSTSYVVVVDPRTAWPPGKSRRFRDFGDGLRGTILVMEGTHDVPWTAPRDISFQEAVRLLSDEENAERGSHRYENFFFVEHLGRNVALADGSVAFLYFPLAAQRAASLLRVRDGSGKFRDQANGLQENLNGSSVPSYRRLKVDNCVRLAIFLLLMLLPLPWALLKSRPGGQTPASPATP